MATKRLDSLYDLPALEKENQRVAELFKSTIALMGEVQKGIKTTSGTSSGAQLKKEITELTKANDALVKSMAPTITAVQSIREQTRLNNLEAKQQAKAIGLVGGGYDKLSGKMELLKRQYKNLAAEEKHTTEEGKALLKNITDLDTKIKAIDASVGNHQRNVGNYASAWDKLSVELAEAKLKLRDLALEEKHTSEEGQKLVKTIQDIERHQKQATTVMGGALGITNTSATGFNALGNSINQVSRELPAFTISAQTGFLAISNNLPILADAIGGLRAQNKALAAEGKPTVNVLKQIGSAIFSWGTALSIGITLLTVYGKDIVDFIMGTDKAAESTKKLKEAQEHAIEAVSDEAAKIEVLVKTLESETTTRKEKNKAIDELKKMQPDFFGNLKIENGLVQNLSASYIAYKNSILSAAKAAAIFEQIKALTNKRLNIEIQINQKDLADAQAKSAQIAKEAQKAQQTGDFSRVSILTVAEQKALALSNQIASIDDEINALFAQTNPSDLVKGSDSKGGGDKSRLENAKSFAAELMKTISDTERLRLQAEVNAQERIQANEKDTLDARITALQIYYNTKEKLIAADMAAEMQELNNQRSEIEKGYAEKIAQAKANGESTVQIEKARQQELISFDKFAAAQRKYIAEKFFQDILDLNRDVKSKSDAIYASQPGGPSVLPVPEVTQEQANELLAIVDKTLAAELKKYEDYAKKREELMKALHDKEYDLAQQAFDTLGAFVDGAFDRKKNAIQDEIDLITERTAKEIEAVRASTLTEQEKADSISAIQASAQARKEALELKQRKIQQQQAMFERAFQIFQIGIETTRAVNKIQLEAAALAATGPAGQALAQIARAQIPVAIASGALSIAAVLAKPIPKFAVGTKSSPEGLAWVGEKGTEGRINPDGSFELTPNKPTLTYLQKGTEIIPNKDLLSMLPGIAMDQRNFPINEDTYAEIMVQKLTAEMTALGGKLDEVKSEIRNKKETHFSFGPDGFKAAVKQGATWTEYLNRGWKE